ncbi:SAM-dependent methyltransferase [Lachnoclostridium sp. An169]|uniref:RsmF rRNA methyltransferase first C-terminal domain-containing protein n=1 Tax=Lachnoclostridium sp. An169 TaxID=1965569 RepID=UPI000B39BEE5|nr:RsmB/NOP family class I SAM-dependent RNA methyltransferase [Lachnoclostridium sp. An169]OUP83041.1 SAM-dependent methyltransferase [Lachnoclostridium sp. An169]
MNLPDTFEKNMRELLGEEEYGRYLACFDEPRHYGLRVNTSKISVEDFLEIAPWPLERVPWIHNGFYYDGEKYQPAKHPYYFAGLYYLQEPSAMTPADRLPVEAGDRVLDVCAAPGGKATELGAKLGGTGLLAANDLSNSRAKGLLKNLELFGIGNVLVLSEEPGKLVPYFREYFDKILIDAPCSGEGMFRKDRKMVRAWEEHGPGFFSKIQRSIVMQAADMLRPGGLMLYSTCTFSPEENEQTIEYLLENHPEFTICEMEGYEGFSEGIPEASQSKREDLKKTVRIFPHRMKGEGHFLALLKKGEATSAGRQVSLSGKPVRLPGELAEFLALIDRDLEPSRIEIRGERVCYMPEGVPELKGIRFLRTGLLLGELKKNRFEPSQALAMNLKREEYANILDLPVSDERVVRYLKGETLDVEDLVSRKEKGWYLVCVDGYPLGFGKLGNQMLKNKYLPGWRWQS